MAQIDEIAHAQTQRAPLEAPWIAGAQNLLRNAVGLREGENLLIVEEPAGHDYYEARLGGIVAGIARDAGAKVTQREAPLAASPAAIDGGLLAAIETADHTIFFSRVGTTARFLKLPGPGSKTVVYIHDADTLGSPFGTTHHRFLEALHDRLVARIARAQSYRITTKHGTDLRMTLREGDVEVPQRLTPFTVRNFPVMIYPPISAQAAHGRLVLELALLPTSVNEYDDPVVLLPTPVTLEIADGEIAGFSGEASAVKAAANHIERVGNIAGHNRLKVNSWHTGINPSTRFEGKALANLAKWGSAAFGSPRYTHFHMVGSNPGEICGSIFDATVWFDDEPLWADGRFAFLQSDEIRALAAEFGADLDALQSPQPIGI